MEQGMTIVGEADDQESAMRLARALLPRIVLLDAEIPNLDLGGTVQAIRSIAGPSVVILTLHPAAVTRSLGRDTVTVVSKHTGTLALLSAIRRAAEQDG
jgi:DNA-binding NarL/FixJ family response regulator